MNCSIGYQRMADSNNRTVCKCRMKLNISGHTDKIEALGLPGKQFFLLCTREVAVVKAEKAEK